MNCEPVDDIICHIPNDRDPSNDHDAQSAILTQRASHKDSSMVVMPLSAASRPWEDGSLDAQRTIPSSSQEKGSYLPGIESFVYDLRDETSYLSLYSNDLYDYHPTKLLYGGALPDDFFQSPLTTYSPDTTYGNAHSPSQGTLRDAPALPESRVSNATENLVCEYPECKASFSGPYQKGNQQRHMRIHQNKYDCEAVSCERVFQRQDARLIHYRRVHPEFNVPSAVPRSSQRSLDARTANRYSSLVTATRSDYGLDETAPIVEHLSLWHGPLSETDLIVSASSHQATHHQANPELDYRAHAADATESVDIDFFCPRCDKSFRRVADLRRHALKHEKPQYTCDVPGCARSFYRKDKLRDHVRQAHKGTLSITDEGILQVEVGEETEKSETPSSYTCTQCGLDFSTMGQLNSHINRKHNQRFKCNECDKAFNLRADLNRHKVSVHHYSSESSWRCPNVPCGKVFFRKDNFQRHVQNCKKSSEVPTEDDVT
jgi:uncharacterized C2H2 Zn-finger protein